MIKRSRNGSALRERFSHNVAGDVACTVATKAFALPRPIGARSAKAKLPPLARLPPPRTASGRLAPSLTATRFEIRISLCQRKKGPPLGGNVALITHLVVKYRAKQALLALLQLQVSSALARRSVEET